jgi:hypothetical protein
MLLCPEPNLQDEFNLAPLPSIITSVVVPSLTSILPYPPYQPPQLQQDPWPTPFPV